MKILTDAIVVEPFDDRVEILADELEHAIAYGVSSILLVVYQSEFVRADVEAVLAERLQPLAQRIERVFINEDNYDLPLYLRQRADKTTTVYSISGLRFGGGEDGRNAYRALNIRREYFVDDSMRVIFWLTEDEAFNLPRYAPDFWAFRHRTVEFMDVAQPHQMNQHVYELTWRGWHGSEEDNSLTFTRDTAAKVAYREQLLSELSNKSASKSAQASLLQTLAPLYATQKEYEKAIVAYNAAIAIDPEDAAPYNGLGNVYNDFNRTDDAIAAYKKAIALNPKSAAPYNGLGNVYKKNGRYSDAITVYKEAIALDSKFAFPHNGLGNVYQANGRYEEAIIAYKKAIILDPKMAYPHNGLGIVYAQSGRYEDAVTAYRKAITLNPKDATPHSNLGLMSRQNGRFKEAIHAYKKAIELDPKDGVIQMSLASIYRKQGQTAVYKKQIEITRPLIANADAYNRACFASIAGEVEEAVELLKEAIAIAPHYRQMAQNDPDFEFIRDDPRFQALVNNT